ncbi:MAG: hypothetical protein JSS45_08450 [Proteobacteria bacterium]|nr:hypothetical protein [Pseudomonadota bacterium]MBS0598845.1 hypothetical protein [Pseudomonadota bacterium]
MITPASIEVFQELQLDRGHLSHAAVRQAVLVQPQDQWRHVLAKEEEIQRYATGNEDVIAFERDALGDVPDIGLMLWQRPEGYRVSNIVPRQVGQLSYGQYNAAVQDFAAQVARPAAEQAGFRVTLSEPRQSLTAWMSDRSAQCLLRFSRCANKSTGASHPLDHERWIEFLISSHQDGQDAGNYLSRWLVEAEHWPQEVASDLAIQYEQARALLTKYDQQRE